MEGSGREVHDKDHITEHQVRAGGGGREDSRWEFKQGSVNVGVLQEMKLAKKIHT